MPKKTYKSYSLPSNFNEMENFIINNKVLLMEEVVNSIEYALTKKLQYAEVFNFTGSEFIISVPFDKFEENVKNIYEYYLKEEKYELCVRIKKLEKKLIKAISTNEKQKQKKNRIC